VRECNAQRVRRVALYGPVHGVHGESPEGDWHVEEVTIELNYSVMYNNKYDDADVAAEFSSFFSLLERLLFLFKISFDNRRPRV